MTQTSHKGFTLAELLFASAILALVLTGILALFTNCIFLNETNRNLSIATSHAQYALEEIKSAEFSAIAGTYDGACWDSQTIAAKGLVALSDDERICISAPQGEPLKVEVTVEWSGRNQRTWRVQLSTLITEYDIWLDDTIPSPY
ncbi:MAG: prepilin-type N-terminal cleavage/methylation domain-containing protein [Candidatus Omnitrophota bacterium]|jgi:prepilin-type N-terminal cleavage/methylation domain-containing protein